jgi:hypothetical protein
LEASADLVRVVDDDMHDIPQDAEAMGEVVMRGPKFALRERESGERET